MGVLERIIALQQIRNLKDTELEEVLSLKPKTIDSWKRGNSQGYLKIIVSIATYFDVSTDYLLGLTDEKKARPSADERTVVNSKIMEIYEALPVDKQQLAEDYLEYLLSRQEKPKDN